jgi:hypothetical protein
VVENISVRELTRYPVSIQMNGRMTYADYEFFDKPIFFRWFDSSTDRIFASVDTNSGTGKPKFFQEENDVSDIVQGNGSYYTPGILVPFNIASRHGMTFVNGALNGVALTANTTPKNLPDLSATDLNLAYDYMGTVERFRVWGLDLGDGGIEGASS